jgi:hypothetical protein
MQIGKAIFILKSFAKLFHEISLCGIPWERLISTIRKPDRKQLKCSFVPESLVWHTSCKFWFYWTYPFDMAKTPESSYSWRRVEYRRHMDKPAARPWLTWLTNWFETGFPWISNPAPSPKQAMLRPRSSCCHTHCWRTVYDNEVFN